MVKYTTALLLSLLLVFCNCDDNEINNNIADISTNFEKYDITAVPQCSLRLYTERGYVIIKGPVFFTEQNDLFVPVGMDPVSGKYVKADIIPENNETIGIIADIKEIDYSVVF